MRCLPRFLIALLFCVLMAASACAQQMQCDPYRHWFGKVQVGGSGSFSFQLSNSGSRTLRIASISVQGSAFSLGGFHLPAHVKPGASVLLPVNFTPTAPGHTSGTLTLVSNAPDSPLELKVAGNGVDSNSQLGVSPATLNFGNVTVGSSASLPATLTASGAAVTISSDESTSSEFAILGLNLPVTIPVGQSLPVTIQFTPNASGTASGQAEFFSNAADSPTVEQLTGTGVPQGSHSVDLSWDPGDGNAVGYNVYRGSKKEGLYEKIDTGGDTTNYTDYTVVSGKTYYYVVTEVNAQGEESPYSNVAKAVIPNP